MGDCQGLPHGSRNTGQSWKMSLPGLHLTWMLEQPEQFDLSQYPRGVRNVLKDVSDFLDRLFQTRKLESESAEMLLCAYDLSDEQETGHKDFSHGRHG
eukprot:1147992-Pelagomonas_calceolata.AAC.14